MKKILASILAAALVLCGAAVAEAEMEPLAQNISAGGVAAVGAEGELYFSLNGLQRMNAEGGVETLFEGEVSCLQYVDGALYFVGSEAVDEYGDATKMTGRKAYVMMRREFQKDGIDLEDYAVPDGKIIKKTEIEKPMIMATNHLQFGKTYENVHHLDFHSSYPGGLARLHPGMRKTIERIYAKRKSSDKDAELKLALDASIGFFQSQYCKIGGHGYALANLARDAVNDNNERIRRVTAELVASGRTPLLYNTDGIWYIGEPLECGADYGPGVGKWENDHTALKFRAKSRGAYEYIDADGYHPVVRGKTKLEETKSRDTWEWGDIFQIGGVKKFGLSQNGTVIGEYVDEDEE